MFSRMLRSPHQGLCALCFNVRPPTPTVFEFVSQDTILMPDRLLRRFFPCLAAVAGLVIIAGGCSSPIDSRSSLAPKQDAWGDCLTSGAHLPADSTWGLVDAPRDTLGGGAPGYAEQHLWFQHDEPIELNRREYVRFGRLRRFHPAGLRAQGLDLRRVGEYKGVPLYQLMPGPERPEVVFVPLRPGCLFYPYQVRHDRNMRWDG